MNRVLSTGFSHLSDKTPAVYVTNKTAFKFSKVLLVTKQEWFHTLQSRRHTVAPIIPVLPKVWGAIRSHEMQPYSYPFQNSRRPPITL